MRSRTFMIEVSLCIFSIGLTVLQNFEHFFQAFNFYYCFSFDHEFLFFHVFKNLQSMLHFFGLVQQIEYLFVVNFYIRTTQGVFFSFFSIQSSFENIIQTSENYAIEFEGVGWSQHSVSFTCSGLSIGKNSCVYSFQSFLNNFITHLMIDMFICILLCENPIEIKHLITLSLIKSLYLIYLSIYAPTRSHILHFFLVTERSHSQSDFNFFHYNILLIIYS